MKEYIAPAVEQQEVLLETYLAQTPSFVPGQPEEDNPENQFVKGEGPKMDSIWDQEW